MQEFSMSGWLFAWQVVPGVAFAKRNHLTHICSRKIPLRTPCVLGQPLGHPPGPHWERAVSDDWDHELFDNLVRMLRFKIAGRCRHIQRLR